MKGKREAEKSQEMTRLREKGRIRKQNERRKEEKIKRGKYTKEELADFYFCLLFSLKILHILELLIYTPHTRKLVLINKRRLNVINL